jgi:hypothetical protein
VRTPTPWDGTVAWALGRWFDPTGRSAEDFEDVEQELRVALWLQEVAFFHRGTRAICQEVIAAWCSAQRAWDGLVEYLPARHDVLTTDPGFLSRVRNRMAWTPEPEPEETPEGEEEANEGEEEANLV